MEKGVDRRGFVSLSLAGAGVAAGFALGTRDIKPALAGGAEDPGTPVFPFTWHKLDYGELQKRCFKGFYDLGGCSRTVFNSVMGHFAEEYGYPYNQIPSEMLYTGHTGYTQHSLCGSLGGAAALIGLFIPLEDQDRLLGEVQTWYSGAELPIYQPEMDLVQTVADSVNCLDSLGTWMFAANVTDTADPKRRARCAGVSSDVVLKTCQLIDEYYGLTDAAVGEAATVKVD